jgi:hypothetical protein
MYLNHQRNSDRLCCTPPPSTSTGLCTPSTSTTPYLALPIPGYCGTASLDLLTGPCHIFLSLVSIKLFGSKLVTGPWYCACGARSRCARRRRKIMRTRTSRDMNVQAPIVPPTIAASGCFAAFVLETRVGVEVGVTATVTVAVRYNSGGMELCTPQERCAELVKP